MKVAVLYLRITKRTETFQIETPYEIGHVRFLEKYRQFRPDIRHDLLIVQCGGSEELRDFDSIATHYLRFDGPGSDCAAYQAVGRVLDYDLVLCLNTLAYPCQANWLEPFVEAFKVHGKGVYGATGSYEINPHLRTPGIAFHPDLIRSYPFPVTNREQAHLFECGPDSLSLWAEREGYPTVLVTRDGRYYKTDWRRPPNIFRRGDQSNCLIFDRHTDLWAAASPEEKARLSRDADQNYVPPTH